MDIRSSDSESDILAIESEEHKITEIVGIDTSDLRDESNFFVKFHGKSYGACQWVTKKELLLSENGKSLLYSLINEQKTFTHLDFLSSHNLYVPVPCNFSLDYLIPEKVISMKRDLIGTTKFLIKWKSLSLSDATWELDAPRDLVEEYLKNLKKLVPIQYDQELLKNAPREEIEVTDEFLTNYELTEADAPSINRIYHNWQNHRNIVYNDTTQKRFTKAIALLDMILASPNVSGISFIFTRLSEIPFWISTIQKYTTFRTIDLSGTERERQIIKEYCLFSMNENGYVNVHNLVVDIILIPYETLAKEMTFIGKFSAVMTIFDCGSILGDFKSAQYYNCQNIKTDFSLVLSEIPKLSNRIQIYSFLHFVAPLQFKTLTAFDEKFFDQNSGLINRGQIENNPQFLQDVNEYFYNDENLANDDQKEITSTGIIKDIEEIHEENNIRTNQENNNSNTNTGSKLTTLINSTLQKFNLSPVKNNNNSNVLDDSTNPNLPNTLSHIDNSNNNNNVNDDNTLNNSNNLDQRSMLNQNNVFNNNSLNHTNKLNHVNNSDILINNNKLNQKNNTSNSANSEKSLSVPQSGGSMNDIKQNGNIIASDEFVIVCELTELQRELVKVLIFNHQSFIHSKPKELMLLLRKVCCQPYLFREFQNICISDYQKHNEIINFDEETFANIYLASSGKMILLNKLVRSLVSNSQIVLIYTKFPEMIPIFEKVFKSLPSDKICYLTKNYKKGLNYNCVIKFDQSFNHMSSSTLKQRNSDKPVSIYHLISHDSIESELYNSHITNSNLSDDEIIRRSVYFSLFGKTNYRSINGEIESILTENAHLIFGLENSKFIIPNSIEAFPDVNSPSFWQTIFPELQIPHQTNTTNNPINNSTNNPNNNSSNNPTNNPQTKNQTNSILQPRSEVDKDKENMESQLDNELNGEFEYHLDSFVPMIAPPKNNAERQIFVESPLVITDKEANQAIAGLNNHGLLGLRLSLNANFFISLAKCIYCAAYLRLPLQEQVNFRKYVLKHLGDVNYIIDSFPSKQIKDEKWLEHIFKGNESQYFKTWKKIDESYIVSIYLSNERLPPNFVFAPSMEKPIGWTPIEDFILVSGSLFMGKTSFDLIRDDAKLPFSYMTKEVKPSKEWFLERKLLIINELLTLIPPDYEINNKKICNVNTFVERNQTLFNSNVLTRNDQKTLLRVLYLYGIPGNDIIPKIKKISMINYVSDETIGSFLRTVTEKASTYQNIDFYITDLKKYDNKFDISWIPNSCFEAIADNISTIGYVRFQLLWYNKHTVTVQKWAGAPEWWDKSCDKVLYNITGYYGFLFLSEISRFIPTTRIKETDIYQWREIEAKTLTPYCPENAKYIKFLKPLDLRKKRLKSIISEIIKAQKSLSK
ncbi:hypothetical protein TRFO_06206 [Tritrichomonas foetus]|uniref:Chromo domain-containing protein n=1 Tax=Tritrichomonas foetus TaxID=1144522 RepID=A0A1J4K0J2_9EUKA|nr:hypothetical protein TRFO_06206 [Tritrichomonas foetus]|eukprot:OHT04763.1 hypothetical protein TRFO_06206 [Tritrichomonas foetus]